MGNHVILSELGFVGLAASGHQHYDLSLYSMRFLMVKHGERSHPTSVHIIENLAADLKENSTL